MIITNLRALEYRAEEHHRVALVKSEQSGNRGYCSVDPTVHHDGNELPALPQDRVIGIGYPCLEDGINDLSVIISTMTTLSYFDPSDKEMFDEFLPIIEEHRVHCKNRIVELRERTAELSLTMLGGDLREFKAYAVKLAKDGLQMEDARQMYNHSILESGGDRSVDVFRHLTPEQLLSLSPRDAALMVYSHLIDSLDDPNNFKDVETFQDRIFLQYMALMNLQWRTTPKIFHGVAPEDYGMNHERSKHDTAMYREIADEIREYSAWRTALHHQAITSSDPFVLDDRAEYVPTSRPSAQSADSPRIQNERKIMPTISTIVGNANLLMYQDPEFGVTVELHMKNILRQLQAYGVLSNVVQMPNFFSTDERDANPAPQQADHPAYMPITLFRFLHDEIVDRIGKGVDDKHAPIYARIYQEVSKLTVMLKEQGFFRPEENITFANAG